MALYYHKKHTVEAIKWDLSQETERYIRELMAEIKGQPSVFYDSKGNTLTIQTESRQILAKPFDFLVRTPADNILALSPDDFYLMFERLPEGEGITANSIDVSR